MSQTKLNLVKKSNDKSTDKTLTTLTHVKARKVNVVGNLEGKVLQDPLNDQEEYQNVDSEMVRVPIPEDGSVPTWRVKNGKIFPMTKVKNEEGEWEYKPRAKKGPKGPRKNKAAKIAADKVADQPKISTDVFGEMSEILTTADAVDFQALVHAWQMRSIGALNDSEFQMIKSSIFEKRQDALTTQASPVAMAGAGASEMTF